MYTSYLHQSFRDPPPSGTMSERADRPGMSLQPFSLNTVDRVAFLKDQIVPRNLLIGWACHCSDPLDGTIGRRNSPLRLV